MAERRYQEVHSRSQVMLLPPCLDDYVSENNAVRAIDAFVGTLDSCGSKPEVRPDNRNSPRNDPKFQKIAKPTARPDEQPTSPGSNSSEIRVFRCLQPVKRSRTTKRVPQFKQERLIRKATCSNPLSDVHRQRLWDGLSCCAHGRKSTQNQ